MDNENQLLEQISQCDEENQDFQFEQEPNLPPNNPQ